MSRSCAALLAVLVLAGCAMSSERLKERGIEKHGFHFNTRLITVKWPGNLYRVEVAGWKDDLGTEARLPKLVFLAAAKTALANGFPKFLVLPGDVAIQKDEDAVAARKKALDGRFNVDLKRAGIKSKRLERCRKYRDKLRDCEFAGRFFDEHIVLLSTEEVKGVRALDAASVVKKIKKELSLV